MSDPTGLLFLAVTTSDGKVLTTIREASTGNWSPFKELSELSGHKNVEVTGNSWTIFATDSSTPPRLWFTYYYGTWQPAKKALTGIAPAVANRFNGADIAVLGAGTTVGPAGTQLSLPLYLREGSGVPLTFVGNLLDLDIDSGGLDLTDFPFTPAIEGHLRLAPSHKSYQLCLVNGSGGLFYTKVPDPGGAARSGLIDVKAASGSDPGTVRNVSCSMVGEGLQVCVVNDLGEIHHAFHNHVTGGWSTFGNVSTGTGTTDTFVRIAVQGFNGFDDKNPILHLVGITDSGRVLHTIRQSDGTWLPFFDVKSKAGDPGFVTSLCVDVNQYNIP